MSDSSPLPPVRLRSEAELARDALAAPLLARAARLARWAGPGTRVGEGGELRADQVLSAAAELGLDADPDAARYAEEAWDIALGLGFVRVVDPGEGTDGAAQDMTGDGGAQDMTGDGQMVTVGAELDLLTSGSPADVLHLWLNALEITIAEASLPEPDGFGGVATTGGDEEQGGGGVEGRGQGTGHTKGPSGGLDEGPGEGVDGGASDGVGDGFGERARAGFGEGTDGSADGGPGWADADLAAESDFLDGVLGNLYLLSVGEDGAAAQAPAPDPSDRSDRSDRSGTAGGPVPLPALAASMIVPEGMTEPTNDVLHEVSLAMVRLDEQFRMLARVGLVEFQPVDEALMADVEGAEDGPEASGGPETDVTRYGMVRLTPLGRFGLRTRLAEAGFEAPVVGDLADKGADALLHGTADFPQAAAQEEIEQWLARHEPLAGARELLAAARGADDLAPLRRLRCQQALSLVGMAAEPALREVLGDRELGGLARVWLTEQGAPEVPPPTENMVFWLTIDTLAAQLAAEGNSEELQSLLQGLVDRHGGFFDTVWRVDHPATARVLQTMGRLHPDKRIAKEARKAAFKARSQSQHDG